MNNFGKMEQRQLDTKRDMETVIREIDARQQIHDCMMRYCRGVDHADPDLALSAYHTDATDDHGSFNGPAKDFVKISLDPATRSDVLRHLICNEYVEFDQENPHLARAETAVLGTVLRRENDGYRLSVLSCRYLDRFEERAGRWLIADRRLVLDWEAGGPVLGHAGSFLSNGMLRGIMNTSDPSYGHGFKLWGDAERLPVTGNRIGTSRD